jgi:hypothetical protein
MRSRRARRVCVVNSMGGSLFTMCGAMKQDGGGCGLERMKTDIERWQEKMAGKQAL